jgi:hypothetical protein
MLNIEAEFLKRVFFLDEPHELLPTDLSLKAPAIVIHTCEDNNEVNNIGRDKLIRPTLIQTKRPPRTQGHA